MSEYENMMQHNSLVINNPTEFCGHREDRVAGACLLSDAQPFSPGDGNESGTDHCCATGLGRHGDFQAGE
jgi:hypothetical protein